MQNILNNRSTFQKVYVDQRKISNWLIYTENRKTDVLKNLRGKKFNPQ